MNIQNRMVGPNGEIIEILPITINRDRNSGKFFAIDERSGSKYSIHELEQMAKEGDPSAQCAMGDYYGIAACHVDLLKSLEWYKKATDQDHAQALCRMANYYASGRGGIEKDLVKSKALLEEAAKHGSVDGMFFLGLQCICNKNEKNVYDTGIYWLEQADKYGHPNAKSHLEMERMLYQMR